MRKEESKKKCDNKHPRSVIEHFYFKPFVSTSLPGDIYLEKKLWNGNFMLNDYEPNWNLDILLLGDKGKNNTEG